MHRDAPSFGLENYCGLVNTFYKDCQSRPKKISKIQRGEKRDENCYTSDSTEAEKNGFKYDTKF